MKKTEPTPPSKPDARQHHWLVAGEITFTVKNDKDEEFLNVSKHNCVIFSMEKNITVHQISRTQQTLQMHFMQRIGVEANPKITNVVILGIMYLGHMTRAEFNAVPEGMKLQEMQPNELSAVAGNA